MANYNIFTVSNEFEVINIPDFKEQLEKVDGLSHFEFHKNGLVCVATYEGLYSNFEDDAEFEYDDYLKLIQKHMKDGQKVIVSSVGHEKLRYLTADCSIITKDEITFKNFFNNISKEFYDGANIF